ncbi:hypothetical protein MD537_23280, partial [Flavihumibacter sediminis]|nr:hypothetical protein [Flavihumibacter sediminis]
IICLGTILLAILFKRYLSRVLSRIIFKIIKSRSWKIDQHSFVELVFQPMQVFLIVSVTMIALDNLKFPALLNIKIYQVEIRDILASIAKGIWVIIFIWLLRR